MQKKFKHWMLITSYLVVYDVVTILFSYGFALWLRFDCHFKEIPSQYFHMYLKFIPLYIIICLVVYWFFKLYQSIWRFASYNELLRTLIATGITFILNILGMTLLFGYMNISYFIFGIVLQFCFCIGIRFSYRFILLVRSKQGPIEGKKSCAIVGAGEAGLQLTKELKSSAFLNERVDCYFDDNPNKWNRYIDGIPVVGGRDSIIEQCKERNIKKIYVAIPTADAQDIKDILNICKETSCELKRLPGMYQILNGQVSLSKVKDVNIEDLLGRDTIKVNNEEIFKYIQGKTILVTGGGGSIGSELCRQIAAHNPKQLIIFDVYENNAYDIQLELKRKYPYLKLETIIGSVRDSRKIFDVMETYKPNIVYHAAAHKHVPLMEDSPCEAIKNNAIGTYKTAFAAMANGVERFVLISTDKAVNPTNIMGASKRLCEMIIQSFDYKIKEGKANEIPYLFTHWGDHEFEIKGNPKTEYVAVRFGNVLGSNGSVIPLFKRQIAEGGPVTVTHPDIIRYFMTIPEAVSLVIQAGTNAKGGEIFVLDMGEPVKIDTLARNLIRLSGHTPDGDIKVVYTGLRPGEKLYEEKLMAEEGLEKTDNDLIHIGKPIPFDIDVFLAQLERLMVIAYDNTDDIKEYVQKVVSTYKPA